MTIIDQEVKLDVTPLSGSIGAVINNIDVRDVDDATIAAIRQVWLERKVIFFKEQHLGPDEHLEFASRFGEPTEGHPIIPGIEGYPKIFEIDYTAARQLYSVYANVATQRQGISWHTDVTFVKRPPLGSILNAKHIPASGGDTLFSDQQAAYEDLSPSLQEYLLTLHAVHDGRATFQAALDNYGKGKWEGEAVSELVPAIHPVVRTHPETGVKVLFVNPGFTSHIAELDPRESEVLLSFLYQHSVRPEFVVRYHWSQGDLGFWDNRATQHSVVGDFGTQHRLIQRVTLKGDEPVL